MAYPDFDTVVAIIADELHEPGDDTFVGRCLGDALRELRGLRLPWSEESVTLLTNAAGSGISTRSATALWPVNTYPRNLLAIDNLERADSNNLGSKVRQIPIQEFRSLESGGSATSGYPDVYCFYGDEILWYPAPSGSINFTLDYLIDAARDSSTGDTIDVDATTHLGTHTNAFFQRGLQILKAKTKFLYAMNRSRDNEMAMMQDKIFRDALGTIMRERDAQKMSGRQARMYW